MKPLLDVTRQEEDLHLKEKELEKVTEMKKKLESSMNELERQNEQVCKLVINKKKHSLKILNFKIFKTLMSTEL